MSPAVTCLVHGFRLGSAKCVEEFRMDIFLEFESFPR